jgi:hypothetical protein
MLSLCSYLERLKNAFKSAYMTYNPQSLHFARATLAHDVGIVGY